MKVLFITSSRIGDAVLSTGLLAHIAETHPNAKVTVVCGPLASSLFEGYPNLERIISLKKQKAHKHWISLWRQVVGTKWDMVVDLRNSAISRLIRADQRFIFGWHIHHGVHKVEQNAETMRLPTVPSPKLWFTKEQRAVAEKLIPDGGPVLAVGPAANWAAKTWPAERFIQVIGFTTDPQGLLPGARVAVFAAPGEEDIARKVLNSIPPERRLDVIAKGNPAVAAAALARCDFYVGNDSGLMHCAAAVGVPTVGLFGPSYPEIYRPWGAHADYVSTPETFDQLIAYEGYEAKTAPCLMNSLSVAAVMTKLEEFRTKLRKSA